MVAPQVLIISIALAIVVLVSVGIRISAALARFKSSNQLYTCGHCHHHRRRYQLFSDTESSDPPSSVKCKRCFLGAYKESEEFPWMSYVADFPRLTLFQYLRIRKAQAIIRKRQQEVRSYIAWKREWESSTIEEPPIKNERRIDRRLHVYGLSLDELDRSSTDFDSVRRIVSKT